MTTNEIRIYLECIPFVSNIDNIFNCILLNLDKLGDNDNDIKNNINIIVNNWGQYILLSNGIEINSTIY